MVPHFVKCFFVTCFFFFFFLGGGGGGGGCSMQRCVVNHDLIAEKSMFSSDVTLFFEANRQQQNYSRVVYPLYGAYSEWQQCFFLQAGPGCIHGEAACSYIIAHLIAEY